MNCTCGSDTCVKDSRPYDNRTSIWRKRQCKGCGTVFTTLEQVCETLPTKKGKPLGIPARSPQSRPLKREVKPVDVAPTPRPKRPRKSAQVYELPVQVDAITPKPRNRVEDLKAERELKKLEDYWE